LSRACTDDVLIEVKPLVFRGDEQDFTIDRCPATRPDVLAAASKIDRAISGSQWQALLLGAFPFEGVPSFGKKFLCAGLIGENYDNGECLWWQQAVFVGHGGDEYHYADGFSLQPEFGRWNHRVDEWIGSESSYLIDLWAEAANSTMWQPRGGRLHEPLPA